MGMIPLYVFFFSVITLLLCSGQQIPLCVLETHLSQVELMLPTVWTMVQAVSLSVDISRRLRGQLR